ncbi:beta-galactosidase [Clohesyomyces aquaticus]|uniref:Beta-galactosidase n=1 Tax=Clohesyomyces aquaticus TaxID=1231657 RepID=A0A1Y1ZG22_9PLEO|nr:beta-galactosidase [Clohesyomyces aquaticus]
MPFEIYGVDSGFKALPSNNNASGYTRFTYKQARGATVVRFSNGVLAYLLDILTAYTFFAPPIIPNPSVDSSHDTFVLGPYLARSVHISGSTVNVIGDNANATTVELFTGVSLLDNISWNNKPLTTKRTPCGSLTALLSSNGASLESNSWKSRAMQAARRAST